MFTPTKFVALIAAALSAMALPAPEVAKVAALTGEGTFFSPGLGACGIFNTDSQDIAAVSTQFFDTFPGFTSGNPNNNPMCGKTARVTYQGRTIQVQLTDRCGGCAYGDLDFSPHAFNQLADPSVGRISGISWEIIN